MYSGITKVTVKIVFKCQLSQILAETIFFIYDMRGTLKKLEKYCINLSVNFEYNLIFNHIGLMNIFKRMLNYTKITFLGMKPLPVPYLEFMIIWKPSMKMIQIV